MKRLLDELKLPETLRHLSAKQLQQLVDEVRAIITKVVSKTGGHIASSLGAVELAIALHSTFESPKDKIIWDVGHQAYAHKILTSRKDKFYSLRQFKGISGFPNSSESPHDIFTVGHASTSISQALGLAHARDIKGENYSVIAVIGDAALSSGLAFEGINNASSLKSNMIIILNDNEMSISKNVGSFSKYLTVVLTSNFYNELSGRVKNLVKKLPQGKSLFESARKLKERTRHIVTGLKIDVIFEEMGFKYFGPIDGHSLPLLMSTLHHAKEINGPVLLHILTKKGKGYISAEENPTKFHGTGPFDIESGKTLKNGNHKKTYTQVFGQAIAKIAEKNTNIVAVTAAMVDGTGLELFAEKFPNRFFDVGIAEEHAVTFAGALAKGGLKPVVAIYSTFLQRAYDEIHHDVCLQNAPVVFIVDRAGIVGEDGPTHNGFFDISYLRTIPNIIIRAPKDENELKHMLFTAINLNSPVAIRFPKGEGIATRLDDNFKNMELFKAEVVSKSGLPKVLILALGSMVYTAMEVAKRMGDTTVVNARFAKPIDKDLILEMVTSFETIVTLEEGSVNGGFGSAVIDLLSENKINKPVLKLGLPDQYIEHGTRSEILKMLKLDAEGIYNVLQKGKIIVNIGQ